jgi:glycerophosphoryl diester phosphodiesterase
MKYINSSLITILLFIIITGCQSSIKKDQPMKPESPKIDIQGHRGARGLLPENSIPGFKKAIELKVSTLELDLCVTGDGQLIVSHEPWISPEICSYPTGEEIPDDQIRKINLYEMPYDEIQTYDCGSRGHHRFKEQKKIQVSKPLLIDMIQTVESYARDIGHVDFNYNIELKSQPQGDDLYHPVPSVFADLVFSTLDTLVDWNRITIQSFDFRILKYFRETYPEVQLAALVENEKSWTDNFDQLGFVPEIYSPYFELLNKASINELHKAGVKVIPWTINTREEMKKLIEWGVDGIITDYPNIAIELIEAEKDD